MAELDKSNKKKELLNTFQSAGLEDLMKKEMRVKIIERLQSFAPSPLHQTFQTRIIVSLISEYFTYNQLNYSNSVFLPDSGYEAKILNRHELLSLTNTQCHPCLNAEAQTKTSMLQQIISRYIPLSRDVLFHERQVQTYEQQFPQSIEQIFSSLEGQYRNRLKNVQSKQVLDISIVRRQIELEFKQQYDRDLRRFKQFEMEAIKINEKERARKKYEEYSLVLQQTYKKKIDDLRKQSSKMYHEEESMRKDKDYFNSNERSLLSQQKQLVRMKEVQVEEKGKLLDMTKNIEKDNVRKLQDQLLQKIKQYDTLNIRATERINYEVNLVKLSLQKEYQDKQIQFMQRKKTVDEEYYRIEAIKESVTIIERQNTRLLQENVQLRRQLQAYLTQINQLIAINKESTNRLQAVKAEMDTVQMQVKTLQEKNSVLSSRLHRLQHELSQTRKDLDLARDNPPNDFDQQEEQQLQIAPVPIEKTSLTDVLLKKMDQISRNRRKDIEQLKYSV